MTDWAFRTKSLTATTPPSGTRATPTSTRRRRRLQLECLRRGAGRWVELSTLFGPAVAFAKAHGKKASLPEFASHLGPAGSMAQQRARIPRGEQGTVQAAFYFNHAPTNPANSDCSWPLSTSAEYYQLSV